LLEIVWFGLFFFQSGALRDGRSQSFFKAELSMMDEVNPSVKEELSEFNEVNLCIKLELS
jgi:hypothetical protein